ncbi:MAG: hypothetical protein LBU69_02415, partial [Deltaproteobacteria bacterium]|nr:hypothetical protein [Deltaproteobacteria bacterium]
MTEQAQVGQIEAANRLLAVQRKIDKALADCGRKQGEVTLLAVSKTFPAESIASFGQCGQKDFGESYIQEAREKIPSLPQEYNWHFI